MQTYLLWRIGRTTIRSVLSIVFFTACTVITYTAQAAAPIANDDTYSVVFGGSYSGQLGDNDSQLDGPNDTFSKLTDPSHGSLHLAADGSFTYTANIGFSGSDSFNYQIDDSAGGVSVALVTFNVSASSNFITIANPDLVTLEDTSINLGLSVAQDLFDGGSLQDIVTTDVQFRAQNAGSNPVVSAIPGGVSNIVITGYSTQITNTSGSDSTDDDYQLINARVNLVNSTSSGQLANIVDGKLSKLDQYSWENVPLGNPVLSDPTKVIGYYTGASNPTFSINANSIHIVENHSLETAYLFEYQTSDGDSTNFVEAGNSVQKAGVTLSKFAIPGQLEPATTKQGIIVLNTISAATGSSSSVESKGVGRVIIDLDSMMVSGVIAAEQGESSSRTVTYAFKGYPLIDQRNTPAASPVSVLSSTAMVIGDTTGMASVLDDSTVYIDSTGALVVKRSSGFAGTFTTMITSEFYERTGFSSIASFVSVASDNTFFDSSPVDGVDWNGKAIDEFLFDVPASAKIGLFHGSWDTTGGSDTNENIGLGFAVIDLEAAVSSGSITFIRASTPDLLSWDAVPMGMAFFGSTDSNGNPLYESNKAINKFTDPLVQSATFSLLQNTDGTRTLKFKASGNGGTHAYRDYMGNGHISWLGSEPFSISGVPLQGVMSHGSPKPSGDWEIDFAELPLLSYTPSPHATGVVPMDFVLSSTGEVKSLNVTTTPVADEPSIVRTDITAYLHTEFPMPLSILDSADVDGSESQIQSVVLSGVPTSITLSVSSGTLVNNSPGIWTLDRNAASNLVAIGSDLEQATITATATVTDQYDIDADGVVEDHDNGSGIDEFDELTLQSTFELSIREVPTVVSILVNSAVPTISGTTPVSAAESLSVIVNGVSYNDGDGNLQVSTNGTWQLTIPPNHSISEGSYEVSAVVSHSGGNNGLDTSSSELEIDLTPPPNPGVTSQTTNQTTPLISGITVMPDENTLSVEVNGIVYTEGDGNLVDNNDGSWDLQIPPQNILPDGLYQVIARLTDPAGNSAADPSVDELYVDATAPATPGVTSLATNNTSPVINGTVELGLNETLTVEVNNIVYTVSSGNLVLNGDDTWTLTIPSVNALVEGYYDVIAKVVDSALNIAVDPSSNELLVDLEPPAVPTVSFLASNLSTPTLSGGALVVTDEVFTVTLESTIYSAGDGFLTLNTVDKTWQLTPSSALADGQYSVFATTVDSAGNISNDTTNQELLIDTIDPAQPDVDNLLTNTTTPVITGEAIIAAGEVFTVMLNGFTYTVGDGFLVHNPDDSWTLTLPSAHTLPEGVVEVVATITDLAGNSSSDSSVSEVEVDTIAPSVPTVDSLVTNIQTPTITGNAVVVSGELLTVSVDGKTYTAGDGALSLNGSAWSLTIPEFSFLTEGVYTVEAILTDSASNSSVDITTNELVIDITPPPAPGVTSQATSVSTPTIEGTLPNESGTVLTVVVNGISYVETDAELTVASDGTWSLIVPFANALIDGLYNVEATLTDEAGNSSSDVSINELLVDSLAPATPGVTSLVTNIMAPTIHGTAVLGSGETLSVTVNGVTYLVLGGDLVDNHDGTWTLTIPVAETLNEGSYSVDAVITDSANNTSQDPSDLELLIDTTAPVSPSIDEQITNATTPTITGSATLLEGEALSVEVDGQTYSGTDLVIGADGRWSLVIPVGNELAEGLYEVLATVSDVAGNSSQDVSSDELEIDTTSPNQVVVSIASDSDNNALLSINESDSIISISVALASDVVVGSQLELNVNGVVSKETLTHTHINSGRYTTSTPAIDDNQLLSVQAIAIDLAGNRSTPTTDAATMDLTAPTAPVVTSQISNSATPTISGTVAIGTGEVFKVIVNGVTYATGDGNLFVNPDGSWELAIPSANSLSEGSVEVEAFVTDPASNSTSDITTNEQTIDLTPPAIPTVDKLVTNITNPILTGTATLVTGEVLAINLNGVIYTAGDGVLSTATGSTWSLDLSGLAALNEGIYEVIATSSDLAGNSSEDTSALELEIDTTAPPAPGVTSLATSDFTPTIEGTIPIENGLSLTVEVDGVVYPDTVAALTVAIDGTWSLTIPSTAALPDALYSVLATVTDVAGNKAQDVSINELLIDSLAPATPGVTSLTTNSLTPAISGTSSLASGEVLTVAVNGISYTVGNALVDHGDGTWTLSLPATDALSEGAYSITAIITDSAGNTSEDPSANELLVDTTAPVSPSVTSLLSNDITPTLTGMATLLSGEILTVEVDGHTYTDGDGILLIDVGGHWTLATPIGNAMLEGRYEVVVTVTDVAGNYSKDVTLNELEVDITDPSPVVVSITSDVDDNALLSIDESSGDVTVTIGLPADAVVSNTVTISDGTVVTTVTLSLADVAAGSITQSFSVPVDGETLAVSATLTDNAGNTSTSHYDSITADLSAPTAVNVSIDEDTNNDALINLAELVASIDFTVYLASDTVENSTLRLAINGVVSDVTLTAGHISEGTVSRTTPALVDGQVVVVQVIALDLAGNASDSASDTAIMDLIAPAVPVVTSQITNTVTPVIQGTAVVDEGDTLSVTVNGVTYTAGDGVLVLNPDGSWALTLPATSSLTEGYVEIVATITDTAGNTTGDTSTNEQLIDLTAPEIPTVNTLASNSTTPVVTGSAILQTGEILEVALDGVTYTAGDGNLVTNIDGSWSLQVPSLASLAEGNYEVLVTVTDLAGNSSNDATALELLIDTTAPPAPGVTSQATSDSTPAIDGTLPIENNLSLLVEVNGVSYSGADTALTVATDGTWSLAIPSTDALADALYDVRVTVSDLAGNMNQDVSHDELLIDSLAPATPGVTSLVSNSLIPVINGTASLSVGEILSVVVNGITYTGGSSLVDHGDGNWTLTIPPMHALSEGPYHIDAIITDSAGNTSLDPSNSELLVDTTAPVSPSVDILSINTKTPTITGTAILLSGEILTIEVDGKTYTTGDGNLVVSTDGTWLLTIPGVNALSEGLFDVLVSVTDEAGNYSQDISTNEIQIDLTAPSAVSVSITSDEDDNELLSASEAAPDISIQVTLAVDSVSGSQLELTINGVVSTVILTAENISDGNYTFAIPAMSDEQAIDIQVVAIDIAGNRSIAVSDRATMDLTPPAEPSITAQLTNSATPTITGVAQLATGDTLSVTVNGVIYTVGDGYLLLDTNGSWSLVIPASNSLPEGAVEVVASVTDNAGNFTNDTSTNEQLIDLTPPAIPTVTAVVTKSRTPTLQGTAVIASGDTLSITVDGTEYLEGDDLLSVASDGKWSLIITDAASLSEGEYNITATLTDAAGNISVDSSQGELRIDLTPPVAATIDQIFSNSNPILTGTATLAAGEVLSVEVNGVTYTQGDGNLVLNPDNTWSLTPEGQFPEGAYTVVAVVNDAVGNQTTTKGVFVIDTTAPPAPGIYSQTTSDNTPVIEGTSQVSDSTTLSVSVNGVNYIEGDGNLSVDSEGGWTLSILTALPDGHFEVVAVLTDLAGNVSQDPGHGELLIDATAPASPSVLSVTTNNPYARIEGYADIAEGDTLILEVNGVEYIGRPLYSGIIFGLVYDEFGNWDLVVSHALAEGRYDVTATLIDIVGNSSEDPSSQELLIDLTAPLKPELATETAQTSIPTLHGNATLANGEVLTVSVNGVTYTAGDGSLVLNSDGTWSLALSGTSSLQDGEYQVVVAITDAAGNKTHSVQVLTVDTQYPMLSAAPEESIQSQTPTFEGHTSERDGTQVTVTDSKGNTVCVATVLNNAWACQPSEGLPYGDHSFIASVTDDAGNTTASSFDVTVPDDFDFDGLSNELEGTLDADGDGIPNRVDKDSDNDGIPDFHETAIDTDSDGVPNYLDLDSDNDGLADLIEELYSDQNLDFTVDEFIDINQDGLTDQLQELISSRFTAGFVSVDTDFDGIADRLDLDSDQDGLSDALESDSLDDNLDGIIDNFLDQNGNGLDDSIEIAPTAPRDNDGDKLPDYRDSDSDDDGISDLIESGGLDANGDGVVDTLVDSDKDGIPDSVDVSSTGGEDIDGDGIDDAADASVLLIADDDGDGIANQFDDDKNGDGMIDNAGNAITLGLALPDADNDGVPDYLQANDQDLHLGLGRGGCTIGQSNSSLDPTLAFMALFSMLWVARRRAYKNALIRSRNSLLPLLLMLAVIPDSNVLANDFSKMFYISGSVGGSNLTPDDSRPSYSIVDHSDTVYALALGADVTQRLSVEAQYVDLGDARSSGGQAVGYQIPNISALYYGSKSRKNRERRENFSLFGRLGLGKMSNDTQLPYVRENDYQLVFGAGLEYGTEGGIAIRGEVISYDADAHYAGLGLLYRFGKERMLNTATEPAVTSERPSNTAEMIKNQEQTEDVVTAAKTPVPKANDLAAYPIVILFNHNATKLTLASKWFLLTVAEDLKDNDKLSLAIKAYADPVGDDQYNNWLSKKRSGAVTNYLVNNGASADQVTVQWFGATQRFGDVNTEIGLRMNRRVEIELQTH